MRESVTYQAILQEGRDHGLREGEDRGLLAEARDVIRRLGGLRFGPAESAMLARLQDIESLDTLHHLQARMMRVESWEELFADG